MQQGGGLPYETADEAALENALRRFDEIEDRFDGPVLQAYAA